jgi:ubiquinone/menaquinone biosynthesis C-methylase UbiE
LWPFADTEVFNLRQKKIRDLEWGCIETVLKKYSPGRFLDIGCGTGYALKKAQKLGFSTIGIDPEVGKHGVVQESVNECSMIEAEAEKLPFKNNEFEVVYSSHALEHFQDRDSGLREISRVVQHKGIVIIVVPTGTMAFINFVSRIIFTSHVKIAKFMLKDHSLRGFSSIFLPEAHGSYKRFVIQETMDFSKKHWLNLIVKHFFIEKLISPGLYPYPDFPQFFPFIKSNSFSSSIIFVCKKFS